ASMIVEKVQAKLGLKFHPQLSQTIPRGHTAAFEALRVVRELLEKPDIPGCIVCGLDSYINARSLLWLHQHWRLKTEENSNGVIPGEAAAAVYVQRQPSPKTEAAVKLVGLGFAFEKAGVLSEDPLLGMGLAEAARKALAE